MFGHEIYFVGMQSRTFRIYKMRKEQNAMRKQQHVMAGHNAQ